MSHFSVVVIGPDHEQQLAPYHEFECTGRDDQYVQDVDKTEEARKLYDEATETRVRLADGTITNYWTPEGEYREDWLREPTPEEAEQLKPFFGELKGKRVAKHDWNDGRGYRQRVVELPEGAVEVQMPAAQAERFAEWIEGYYGHPVVPFGHAPDVSGAHRYGYTLIDAQGDVIKTIDRTNPNAKWDWYQVGGRWTGFFKLKPTYAFAGIGEPGLMTTPAKNDEADQVRKGDVDFAKMRAEAAAEAAARWDKVHAVLDMHPPLIPWAEVREQANGDIYLARDIYNGQSGMQALRDTKDCPWEVDPYLVSREAYVDKAAANAAVPFAVVYNGKWYERGEMGWWACVSNEKADDDWGLEVQKLYDSISDDTLLTCVDYHI